jgi:hypothetical protein
MSKRLKSFDDVRRLLASVINRLEAGLIDPAIAGRITFTANVLLRAIEGSQFQDLEKRLAAIEEGK